MEGKLRGGGNYGESKVFDLDGFYFVPNVKQGRITTVPQGIH